MGDLIPIHSEPVPSHWSHLAGSVNLPSDFASRNPISCTNNSCQVCTFVADIQQASVWSSTVQEVMEGPHPCPSLADLLGYKPNMNVQAYAGFMPIWNKESGPKRNLQHTRCQTLLTECNHIRWWSYCHLGDIPTQGIRGACCHTQTCSDGSPHSYSHKVLPTILILIETPHLQILLCA